MRRWSCLICLVALGCSRLLPAAPRPTTGHTVLAGSDASALAADVPVLPQKSPGRVEAESLLARIAEGAASYYRTPRTAKDTGLTTYCQFPWETDVTPKGKSCCDPALDADGDRRCDEAPNRWNDWRWSALQFTILDAHLCQYRFDSSGVLTKAKFTATAYCDLDCDGQFSTFQMTGTGDPASDWNDATDLPVPCTRVDFGPFEVLQDEPAAAPGPTKLPKLAAPSPARGEAESWLHQISAGARTYFAQAPAGACRRFPNPAPATAGGVSCCDAQVDADHDHRCDVRPQDWTAASWVALGMTGTAPRYCEYAFDEWGANKTAWFTATAWCDTDCDGLFATFQLVGTGHESRSGGYTAVEGPSLFADFENE